MGLSKFLSLLTTSTLYFCQALELRNQDPFEGTLTRANRSYFQRLMKDEALLRQFYGVGQDEPLPDPSLATPEFWTRINEFGAAIMYLNCWHINEHESAFLWKNYTDQSDGVAIVSTVERLCESVKGEPAGVYIGTVKYIDYEKDVIPAGNAFSPIFYKRKSFEPEQELRACIWTPLAIKEPTAEAMKAAPKGLTAKCNLDVLVEKVLIAPTTPPWAADVIKAVCARYEKAFSIEQSSILSPAIF